MYFKVNDPFNVAFRTEVKTLTGGA